MIALHLVFMAALSLVMGRAARRIVTSVRFFSRRLGFSDFLVSFVFLGLATSTPEISVAVFSALRGTPDLSLGNLIGANIVILSLLTGLAALIAGVLKPGEFYRDRTLPLFLLVVLAPVYAVADGRLTRVDGIILISAHSAFLLYLYRKNHLRLPSKEAPGGTVGRHALAVAAAIAILIASSYFLVNSALIVAHALGASPLLIGLLMFAIGTNLPELTFVLTGARGRNKNIVLGDLFGSVMVNTPTLGLLALISPFFITETFEIRIAAAFLTGLVGLLGLFLWTKKRLDRREGFALLGAYALFLVLLHVRSS